MLKLEFKVLIAFGMFLLMGTCVGADQHPRWPANGFVPDEKTAVRVAEAVLTPIYGDELVRSEEPFTAKLRNGVWVVSGTVPKGVNGGAAEIKISKKTCEILSVIHEQ